jgi:hypothetical protein
MFNNDLVILIIRIHLFFEGSFTYIAHVVDSDCGCNLQLNIFFLINYQFEEI